MKKNCKKASSKTMLRGLSLLLVMTTLLMLCAGCGAGSAALSSAEETASAANSVADSVVVKGSQSEATAGISTVEETEDKNITEILYPLSGNQTFSIFRAYEANILSGVMDNYYENDVYNEIVARTGVSLEFVSPSSSSEAETFSLMIASGDYTDFLDCVTRYEGGLEMAYAQEIIVDMTPYIDTCLPNYWDAVKNSNEYTQKTVVTTEGNVLSVYGIMNQYIPDGGVMIRSDWVEGVGMELPETADDLFDVMMAIKEKYHPDKAIGLTGSCVIEGVVGAFGIPGISLSGGAEAATNLGTYLLEDGKTVQSSLQSDNYRAYIEYIKKLYDNGLVDVDFYSNNGFGAYGQDIAAGVHAFFSTRSDSIPSLYQMTDDPNFEVTALPGIVGKKGDVYTFGAIPSEVTDRKLSVSTQCEDIETALKYLNWFYTDDAYLICNYGTEGKTYEFDADNIPTYTELITNNEQLNAASIRFVYCFMNYVPIYLANDALHHVSTEREQAAVETWSLMESTQRLPSLLPYTPEESSLRAAHVTDVISYASEVCVAWIIGQSVLDDAAWEDFQNTLKNNFHIDELVACDQRAFDRYNSISID